MRTARLTIIITISIRVEENFGTGLIFVIVVVGNIRERHIVTINGNDKVSSTGLQRAVGNSRIGVITFFAAASINGRLLHNANMTGHIFFAVLANILIPERSCATNCINCRIVNYFLFVHVTLRIISFGHRVVLTENPFDLLALFFTSIATAAVHIRDRTSCASSSNSTRLNVAECTAHIILMAESGLYQSIANRAGDSFGTSRRCCARRMRLTNTGITAPFANFVV